MPPVVNREAELKILQFGMEGIAGFANHITPAKMAFPSREQYRSWTDQRRADRALSTSRARGAGARAPARHAGSRQAATRTPKHDDLSFHDVNRWTCRPPTIKLLA